MLITLNGERCTDLLYEGECLEYRDETIQIEISPPKKRVTINASAAGEIEISPAEFLAVLKTIVGAMEPLDL